MKRIVKNQETSIIERKDVDFKKGIVVYDLKDNFYGYVVNQDGVCYIIDSQGTWTNTGHPFDLLLMSPHYKFYQL